MQSDMLSKRWIVNFERKSAEQNVQYFETGLKVKPVVHAFWNKDGDGWEAWAFVVAEEGHKPWDITEPHVAGCFSSKRVDKYQATTFTAEEFRAAIAAHPECWYRSKPKVPYGTRSWQPYDDKRGVREYINCVYPDPT